MRQHGHKRKASDATPAGGKRQRLDPSKMSHADMFEWLDASKLGELRVTFKKNNVKPEQLPQITSDKLKNMGVVKHGLRKRFLHVTAHDFHEDRPENGIQEDQPENNTHEHEHLPTSPLPNLHGYKSYANACIDEEVLSDALVRNNATIGCCTRCWLDVWTALLTMILIWVNPLLSALPLAALPLAAIIFGARPLGGYVMGIKYVDLENDGKKPGCDKMIGHYLCNYLIIVFCCGCGTLPCCCGGNGHQTWVEQRCSVCLVSQKEFKETMKILERQEKEKELNEMLQILERRRKKRN